MAWLKLPVNNTGFKSICLKGYLESMHSRTTFFEMVTEHRTPDISGLYKQMTNVVIVRGDTVEICKFKENYHSQTKYIDFEYLNG
jgi:hypothetical protein